MDVATFAAERRERLTVADDALRPSVGRALSAYARGEADWSSGVVAVAGQLWLENFEAEAPGAGYMAAMQRFRSKLAEVMDLTGQPDGEGSEGQVERITRWISTYAVNAGTIQGAYARGVRYKMWVDMNDSAVRGSHAAVDGQAVPIGSAWTVAGVKVGHPGEPVGPPSVWINCRCVAMPAAKNGEAMSANTFQLDDSQAVDEPAEEAPRQGALIVMLPAADDPVVAASSEDVAHMTTVWFGDTSELTVDVEELEQAVRLYAQDLDGPIVVPVDRRGELGDDGADVVFLERTDAILAARDGMLANEPIRAAHDAVEQYPEWTPHVTLGYPEGVEGGPAVGEYDGAEVTFDRIGLWIAGEKYEYPMGGTVSTVTADAAAVIGEVDDTQHLEPGIPAEDYQADDEMEDGEEPITEIPVHGVLAPEGVETGDGRGFRDGALSARNLPVPLRLEIVGTHGGDTSEVVTVGRVDEAWRDEATKMWRFRGAVILSKPYAQQAIEGMIDGSGRGVSIDADAIEMDMASFTDEILAEAQAAGRRPTEWFAKTRIAGLTIVPIPAFQEAYAGLGHEFEEDMSDAQIVAAATALADCGCDEESLTAAAFAPGTKDGPGWLTDPIPTGRLRRYWLHEEGAAKIAWRTPGDFRRCVAQLRKYIANPDWLAGACANLHYEANGFWPGDRRNLSSSRLDAATLLVRASGLLASAAPALESAGVERVGIGQVVSVAADGSSRKAAPDVLSMGDTLEVRDSDTSTYSAKVVDVETGRGGAVLTLVREDMGADSRPFAVATTVHGSGPENVLASGAQEVLELRLGPTERVSPSGDTSVVALAHSLAESPLAAVGKFGVDTPVHTGQPTPQAPPAPIVTLVASADVAQVYPSEWFANPRFDQPMGMRIDKATRRIYGHLAHWNTCHIGIGGACVKPPHSNSGYSNFLKGVIDTDAGEQVVGCLTYGIGHANPALRAAAATAHYDRTDAVRAFVNIGEDRHGIWYSGVLRPEVTDAQIDEMRAIGALSGDWRQIGRFGLDLVAAVAVNTPGYPLSSLAASAGVQDTLILSNTMPVEVITASAEDIAANEEYMRSLIAAGVQQKLRERDVRNRVLAMRSREVRARISRKA